MKLHLSTWNHSFRHETTFGDMNDFLRSVCGSPFFNFFLTFMSVRCNLALFSANWPHLTGTKLHFFFFISYLLVRFFATIFTKFALYSMNLLRLWHFQVPFCILGQACEHFLLAITVVWQVLFFCFYWKSLSKSPVLGCRIWGAGPMTTVCYGWNCICALSLQSVCEVHRCWWALCFWA